MKNIYKQFEPIGKSWLTDLNNYNEVPFQRKTSQIKWSLGQIYDHLSDSTIDFHLKGVETCINTPQPGKKSWCGKMVFLKGSFNNKKLKVFMEDQFTPEQPENISFCKDKMIRVLKHMDEWGRKITQENINNKAEHPILGFLTAQEWYKLVILHFDYHKKNKTKIDKFLTN